jgi:hypothetical protein
MQPSTSTRRFWWTTYHAVAEIIGYVIGLGRTGQAGMRRRGCGTVGKEADGRLDGLALGRPFQAVEVVTRKPRVTLIPFRPHHQP